jgi:hypothetical protein
MRNVNQSGSLKRLRSVAKFAIHPERPIGERAVFGGPVLEIRTNVKQTLRFNTHAVLVRRPPETVRHRRRPGAPSYGLPLDRVTMPSPWSLNAVPEGRTAALLTQRMTLLEVEALSLWAKFARSIQENLATAIRSFS